MTQKDAPHVCSPRARFPAGPHGAPARLEGCALANPALSCINFKNSFCDSMVRVSDPFKFSRTAYKQQRFLVSLQCSAEGIRGVQTNLVQLAQRRSLVLRSGEEKDQQDPKAALIPQQTKVISE